VRLVRVAVLIVVCWVSLARAGTPDDARATTGYRKGKQIRVRLVDIDGIEVELATARAFRAMQQAAAEDGIELWIRSGFRTIELQTALYRAWRAGFGNKAARPGYSNHEAGTALDLVVYEPTTLAWLGTHANKFGFRRTVPGEPWHWERVGRRPAATQAAARRRGRS
jgi:LAS superfamily LD-carboxypeptidase LdcB